MENIISHTKLFLVRMFSSLFSVYIRVKCTKHDTRYMTSFWTTPFSHASCFSYDNDTFEELIWQLLFTILLSLRFTLTEKMNNMSTSGFDHLGDRCVLRGTLRVTSTFLIMNGNPHRLDTITRRHLHTKSRAIRMYLSWILFCIQFCNLGSFESK